MYRFSRARLASSFFVTYLMGLTSARHENDDDAEGSAHPSRSQLAAVSYRPSDAEISQILINILLRLCGPYAFRPFDFFFHSLSRSKTPGGSLWIISMEDQFLSRTRLWQSEKTTTGFFYKVNQKKNSYFNKYSNPINTADLIIL